MEKLPTAQEATREEKRERREHPDPGPAELSRTRRAEGVRLRYAQGGAADKRHA